MRHRNWQTGQQAGILRQALFGDENANGPKFPNVIPGPIRRWMGYGINGESRAGGRTQQQPQQH